MPAVKRPAAGGLAQGSRRLIVAAAMAGNRPVVIGCAHPRNGEMVFTQDNREVRRHPSGTYTTTAPDGSREVWHSSGAYLRIGAGAHEDLKPHAPNGWTAGGGAAARITLATAGFSLTIQPNGDVTMTAIGNINVSTQGQISLTSPSTIALSAPGVTVSDNLYVGGGATGTFPTPSGTVVTVRDGIVTNLNP